MIDQLKSIPEDKEKRILVSGEGQEALLVTYFLARNAKLRSEVDNLKIYLVYKNMVKDSQ